MNHRTALRLCALLALTAGVAVSAQLRLPSEPPKEFGASISPAFEGWFDNPDGTHSFLIGYYSRNTEQEVDVPIGQNNKFEPGDADRGQPTHFLTRRRYGMFLVTVPKEFGKEERLWWSLTVNGVTNRIPFHMHTDYNVSPFKGSEESPNGEYNTPPIIRFAESGPTMQGPRAALVSALTRTAKVGEPMPFDIWADDDALYSSGGGGPRSDDTPPVNATLSKYRGDGDVKFASERPKFTAIKGGKPLEPYSGKASTTVTFSEPGDYMLHVTANDYSGNGGGGSVCCWTNEIVKVTVTGGSGAQQQ